MILDPDGPFIPSGGVVRTRLVGTMTSRRIDHEGAAEALAAFSERRAAEDQARGSRRTVHRYRHMSMDERLERLGVGSTRSLPRSRVFDLPL